MGLDARRAAEHVGAGACRPSGSRRGEGCCGRRTRPQSARPRWRRGRGDALGEAAGAENQDVAGARHVLFSAVVSKRRFETILGLLSATTREPGEERMASTTTDVAIIGGGLMGCFSGLFPAPARAVGRRDREGQAVRRPASGVNFGNVRLQGRNPAEFPAVAPGAGASGRISRGSPARTAGWCHAGMSTSDLQPSDQPKLEQAASETRGAAGLDVDLLDGRAARRRWPVLVRGGDGRTRGRSATPSPIPRSPRRRWRGWRLARARRLFEHTEVTGVARTGVRLCRGDRPGADRDLRATSSTRPAPGRESFPTARRDRCRCSPPARRSSRSCRSTPTSARRCTPSTAR